MLFLPAQAGLLPALTFALLLSPKVASSLSIQQEHLALRSPLWDSASRNDSNPLINHSAPPPNLTLLGNNSLFDYWRPKSHLQAPNSWMNDPMTMWVSGNPDKPTFHVSYQYHHAHVNWGNISQGSAYSNDLVTWKDVKDNLNPTTLGPSAEYDNLGVFDGTVVPVGHLGYPSLIYTSVRHLPIGWSIPYPKGAESQSLAYTTDNGTTWKLYENNPVIPAPPSDLNITGFRDPFVFKSQALDKLFHPSNIVADDGSKPTQKSGYYLTVSSGSRPKNGPRLLLYRQSSPGSTNLTSWQYLGPVFSQAGNVSSAGEWGGNSGFNFEVANVLRLSEEGDASEESGHKVTVDFVAMGTEGGRADHSGHWPIWAAGTYKLNNSTDSIVNGGNQSAVSLEAEFSGVADWGESYACLTFLDSTTRPSQPRRLLYCWTYEDDNAYGMMAKGWQGSLTTPRELSVNVVKNVNMSQAQAEEKGSWGVRKEKDGSTSVYTLGVTRAREVRQAVTERSTKVWSEPSYTVPTNLTNSSSSDTSSASASFKPFCKQPTSKFYQISAKVHFPLGSASSSNARAGFTIYRSPNGTERTDIYYNLSNESLIVDRSKSSLVEGFNLNPDVGKLRLWNVTGEDGKVERQPLSIVIVADNSVVEVYANSVFVMTTRVYPWLDSSTGLGFYISPDGSSQGVRFDDVKVQEGLYDAWPSRPKDTSVDLVWDGDGYPWAGN